MINTKLIRERRDALDMTMKDLAEKVGIGRPELSKIVNGHVRDPKSSTVAALAEALGVSADKLLQVRPAKRSRRAR